ncbi:Mitochondrial biogenesis AIM24 [Plasmodiophora brassicae]|uniref:Uncharacterized protein n=1 Tax=Plasmodiophora brassicae TaxID=37360 RepID=A0A0G4IPN4_PLABS|nr:hypothetical protein PBRA_005730 [Plasmodiophora brassicae]SPR01104.1 unnamed protein product [Plasmodiophora brassicae]
MGDQFHSELVPLQGFGNVDAVPQQLEYNLTGRPAFAIVNVFLRGQQRVLASAGKMQWMDSGLQVETSCPDGACGRCLAKETLCMNTFNGIGGITFGLKEPGDILPFAVGPGNGWIVSHTTFVCGTDNIKVSAAFPGCMMACCGGEGFFLTHVSMKNHGESGMFFAGGYGEIIRHDIPAGKTMYIDNGLFFAVHESTKFEIGILNLKTCLFGQQGFIMKFHGPCALFTQSRDPRIFRQCQRGPPGRSRRAGAAAAAGGIQ